MASFANDGIRKDDPLGGNPGEVKKIGRTADLGSQRQGSEANGNVRDSKTIVLPQATRQKVLRPQCSAATQSLRLEPPPVPTVGISSPQPDTYRKHFLQDESLVIEAKYTLTNGIGSGYSSYSQVHYITFIDSVYCLSFRLQDYDIRITNEWGQNGRNSGYATRQSLSTFWPS